ncbi:MAG: lamin tail domain-containing protein [Bacteroidales bacterium]|nr:lamin tail domain-containing protein [Bacteroidales bacterium]
MMKKSTNLSRKLSLILLMIITLGFNNLMSQTTGLFFSEYCEGSSNNKYLEIYNATGSNIVLSEYNILTNYNGSSWSGMHSFPTGVTLAPNDVWVIANNQAGPFILNQADEIFAYNQSGYIVGFNGNDVRALVSITPTDTIIIDIIGLYDLIDPGAAWPVAGVSDGTVNHTLVRKPIVCFGNPDWNISAGTDSINSEWIVYPVDDFSHLGSHVSDCFGIIVDTIPPHVVDAFAFNFFIVKVVFSEAVNATAENVGNYTGLGIIAAAVRSMSLDTVTLSLLMPLQICVFDTLTIANVEDTSGNIMAALKDFAIIYGCQSPEIVITEIMYNPPEGGTDSLEFVELYNNGSTPADLVGYEFTQGFIFTFPSVIINPGEFVLVTVNASAFQSIFGVTAFEWTSGALSNGGEDIELRDNLGNVVDYVDYDDKLPWDTLADGYGPSLALCNPGNDNNDPANWTASVKFAAVNSDGDSIFATPGTHCMTVGIDPIAGDSDIIQIYPNPSHGTFFMEMPEKCEFEVTVYSMMGKMLYKDKFNDRKITLNMKDYNKGVYFINIYNKNNGKYFSRKLILQ